MKINNKNEILGADKNRRLYITLDVVNFILSLISIAISILLLIFQDSATIFYRIICIIFAVICLLSMIRFYRDKPKVSVLCLMLASLMAALSVLL